MKAEELRINNLIQLNGNWTKVLGIKNEKLEIEGLAHWIELKNIDPIPLSEEVLLKCGFKRIANLITGLETEIVYYQNGKIIVYLLKDFFEIEIETSSGIFNLHHTFEKHLHQLQNLYYALTGEELEVSL